MEIMERSKRLRTVAIQEGSSSEKLKMNGHSGPQSDTMVGMISIRPYCFKWPGIHIPTKFAKANGLYSRNCDIELVDKAGRHWPAKLWTRPTDGQPFIRFGWGEFRRGQDLKVGDRIRLELVGGGEKPILKCYVDRLRPTGTGVEATDNRQGFLWINRQSLSMSGLTTITPYCFSFPGIHIPTRFAKENGLYNRSCDMELVDEAGDHWSVKLWTRPTDRQPFIMHGWGVFRREQGLKVGDRILLELVRGGEKPLLKCSIERVGPTGEVSVAKDGLAVQSLKTYTWGDALTPQDGSTLLSLGDGKCEIRTSQSNMDVEEAISSPLLETQRFMWKDNYPAFNAIERVGMVDAQSEVPTSQSLIEAENTSRSTMMECTSMLRTHNCPTDSRGKRAQPYGATTGFSIVDAISRKHGEMVGSCTLSLDEISRQKGCSSRYWRSLNNEEGKRRKFYIFEGSKRIQEK